MVSEAESVGVWLRTLHMHVGDVMDVVIRRVAGATFNKGDFEVFENRVLTRLAHAAAKRRDLFTDRERRRNEAPKRPIEVRLPAPLFTDPKATGEVIQRLERIGDLSFAVVHRNPYLHVLVTDNTDGSNYDLFVTTPSAIEIHPGFRASLGSLTRLSQDLGEYFEADNLREYSPVRTIVHFRPHRLTHVTRLKSRVSAVTQQTLLDDYDLYDQYVDVVSAFDLTWLNRLVREFRCR